MSGPAESKGTQESTENGAGVLANLPRTRPQRASARRTAARRSAGGTQQTPQSAKADGTKKATKKATKAVKAAGSNGRTATSPKPAAKAKTKTGTKATGTAKRSASASTQARRPTAKPPKAAATKAVRRRHPTKSPVAESIPRQGFESEEERATGVVQPPGGTEFVSTAAEIFGELTKAGISGGERLLRDVLSRLGR